MKRTQSEDREAQNGQWAISASTDYLNKRSKDFMVRSNPLGLAEPSVKRDGYAVGSREGSMYRSTGNLNVSQGVAGSRAGSESKDLPKGNWKERRASTSDLKGSGIRVGGNQIEPSAKPCMPFGSGAGGGGGVVRRRQVNKSSQQQKTTRSSSTLRTSTTSTMQQVSTALEQIQVQESRSQVTVALPRGRSRAQSLPRGQVTNEESSFKVSLPASARTSRQASVEPEAQRKLTRHGSVEIYDGSYNLTVPHKQTRSASKSRLEQTKGDHIRIEAGDEENGTEEASSPSPAPAPLPSVQQTYAGPTTVEQTYELPAPAVQQQQQQQVVQQSKAVEQQTSTSSSLCQTSIQQQSSTTVQEVQQTSVEQSSSVQQHSSTQESFGVQQNAVQQSSTIQQESSRCSVEQSSSQQSSSVVQSSVKQTSNQQSSSTQSVIQQQFVTQSAVQQQSSVQQSSVQQSSVQQTSVQQSSQQSIQQQSSVQQSSVQQTSVQQSSQQSIQQSSQQQSIQQSIQQQSSQQQSIQQSGKQRSRHPSGTQDRDAVVSSGGKFNITQGLNRNRSRHQSGSCEQRQATVTQSQGPGAALRGLDTALEKIAAQQRKEDANTGSTTYVAKVSSRQSSRRQSVSATNGEEVTTVTLSLPPSQRGSRQSSRRGSVSEGGGARKSRRGSLDIYTAEYALKIGGGEKKGITAMEQKTAFHMKVENESESDMALCGRCHLPTHKTKACPEFGTLSCPRCLEWGHWEDACWTQDAESHVCSRCDYEGHNEAVHDTEDFKQRRAVVDTLGWEPFQNWFYDQTFRGWWQVTGCVGVPLYRIYPRKTAWRTEKPEVTEDEPVAKSSLTRADSVDDMIAQVKLLSQRRPVVKKDSEDESSGRSTPAHLREDTTTTTTRGKSSIVSETLKSLNSGTFSELDSKK